MADELEKQVNELHVRVAVLEKLLVEYEGKIDLQLGRIISDIESEKATRHRIHVDWQNQVASLQNRLILLEKHVAIGVGILAALQVIIPVALHFIKP